MTASDDEEGPSGHLTAALVSTDHPDIEDLTVLPERINDLIRSMIQAGEELNDIRIRTSRRSRAANRHEELDVLADDVSDADEPVSCKGVRYDGRICIRAREEDVARFETLADEREWSYGRMFHELLKAHDQPD